MLPGDVQDSVSRLENERETEWKGGEESGACSSPLLSSLPLPLCLPFFPVQEVEEGGEWEWMEVGTRLLSATEATSSAGPVDEPGLLPRCIN